VGTLNFSPVDLNCRRSDSERFLSEVLAGIASAAPAVAPEVVVKLHPADNAAHYQQLVGRYPALDVHLETNGDVVDLFESSDIYVTTYSTSLLEAALALPMVYYRVNEQRLGPPFADDEFIAQRTAASPAELAALLCDRRTLATPPPEGWVERYLGPHGAVSRVLEAVESCISSGSREAAAHTARGVAPPP
jgi:hypothetical protein